MAIFKTLTEETRTVDPKIAERSKYTSFKLNELVEGDTFTGEIYLTEIYENEFTDEFTGEMKKSYKAIIQISDDENEETLKANMNLKGLNDKITVWEGSVAYDIIDSLKQLNEPGTEGIHNVYTMSFKELQDHVNQIGIVNILVKSHRNEERNIDWNTFRITGVN